MGSGGSIWSKKVKRFFDVKNFERSQSNHRFPYGYLVTTSPQLLIISWLQILHSIKKYWRFRKPSWLDPERVKSRKGSFFFENVEFQSFGDNQFPWCDGRCVQGSGTYSPQHADLRLLVIPSSWCRVADTNPNWDDFSGFAQICILAPHCDRHCSTCVAQSIRAVRTWRHPHLPPVYHWQFDESINQNKSLKRFISFYD